MSVQKQLNLAKTFLIVYHKENESLEKNAYQKFGYTILSGIRQDKNATIFFMQLLLFVRLKERINLIKKNS